MAGTHQAAILLQKGGPLSVESRSTPEPGPNEILIQVKAVALNPVDYVQRDLGMPLVLNYPAVVGSDVAGFVAKIGSDISNAPPPGTRVIAFASSFYRNGSPDHGAFQEYVLAQSEGVIALPEALSFEQGAILPLAVLTALSGWTTIGIPLDTKFTKEDKQAVIIWGGASSVGTIAVQSAKLLGFTVYTTCSAKNHEYLKELGADVVFDYGDSDVVSQIVDKVQKDGVVLQTAYCVVPGSLQPTLDVIKNIKGDTVVKVAHAPPLLPGAPTLEGADIRFVLPPTDAVKRSDHIYKCFHGWLQNGLNSGSVVPSPRIQVEAGGLEGLNEALDILKGGVSGTKIVVPI
jgi:D-arabinose 1-dehydrogenase-like Zn-dependent alcohol dehydrogenase